MDCRSIEIVYAGNGVQSVRSECIRVVCTQIGSNNFSSIRSTESHTQDKVSMGTIAARDCRRVIELSEQVVAGMMIAVRQALAIRVKRGEQLVMSESASSFLEQLSNDVTEFTDDVFLEQILRNLIESINKMPYTVY